jgi:hypothetical protein
VNISIKTGTTYELKFIYNDVDGVPIDITGASARMQLRRSAYSPVSVEPTPTLNGVAGEVIFKFSPEDTASVLKNNSEAETFLFDALLTLTNGDVILLAEGKAEVKQVITRDD